MGIWQNKQTNVDIMFAFFFNQNDTVSNGKASGTVFGELKVQKICPPTGDPTPGIGLEKSTYRYVWLFCILFWWHLILFLNRALK